MVFPTTSPWLTVVLPGSALTVVTVIVLSVCVKLKFQASLARTVKVVVVGAETTE